MVTGSVFDNWNRRRLHSGHELHVDARWADRAPESSSASSRRIRGSRDRLTNEGADVLINISNDGYLGPTAVMRQHLANAIFRAVENGRPVLRVTNTGITAFITTDGQVKMRLERFKQTFESGR